MAVPLWLDLCGLFFVFPPALLTSGRDFLDQRVLLSEKIRQQKPCRQGAATATGHQRNDRTRRPDPQNPAPRQPPGPCAADSGACPGKGDAGGGASARTGAGQCVQGVAHAGEGGARSFGGTRACGARNQFWLPACARFRAGLPAHDDATWRRAAGWSLNFALAVLDAAEDDPILAGIGRRTLEALRSDRSVVAPPGRAAPRAQG